MRRIKFPFLIVLIGGLLLAACAGPQAQGPVQVNVTLKEFSVESSVTEFNPGVPYHFIVKNEGLIPHEFMIMPVAMQGMDMTGMPGMTMEELDAMALFMIPQEELPAGATAEADYTFEGAAAGENLEIVCTLPGHLEAGMRIPVTVK